MVTRGTIRFHECNLKVDYFNRRAGLQEFFEASLSERDGSPREGEPCGLRKLDLTRMTDLSSLSELRVESRNCFKRLSASFRS